MNLKEILNKSSLTESVTFGVSRLVGEPGDQRYESPFEKEHNEECWVCDGTGIDSYHHTKCDMCNGTKKLKSWKPEGYEELNVSNANVSTILSMLGLPPTNDYIGVWEKNELPVLRRRLIALKNKSVDNHVIPPSETQNMRKDKDENGLTRIGRGPRMIDFGVSERQINHYIDSLLQIIDFAQKNDAVVTWA